MSLNPLSQELQKTGYGYQLDEQTKINHLFYVDDLKLYGTSDNQLTGLINTVKIYRMTSRWNLDWTSVQRHHSYARFPNLHYTAELLCIKQNKNKVLPPYVNSPCHKVADAGNSTSSFSISAILHSCMLGYSCFFIC